MSAEVERHRVPRRIIVVVVLTYIGGILDILAGIVIILLRYDAVVEEAGEQLLMSLLGAAIILIGLLTVAMASGLTRGRNSARIFVTALMALSLVVSATDFVREPSSPWRLAIDVVVSVLVILALWVGKGGRFFRRARSAAPAPSA